MITRNESAGITAGQEAAILLVSGLAIGDHEQVKAAAMMLAKEHGVGDYAERFFRRSKG